MPDANDLIDVYCDVMVRDGKSIFITLEFDDLPHPDEAEKLIKERLRVGGNKVTIKDVMAFCGYINIQNRITRRKK